MGQAVFEFSAFRPTDDYDVKRGRPERLVLTLAECSAITRECNRMGMTDISFVATGSIQPGPASRRLVEVLGKIARLKDFFVPIDKLSALMAMTARHVGVRWNRSFAYDNPQDKPAAQRTAKPATTSWQKEADASIHRAAVPEAQPKVAPREKSVPCTAGQKVPYWRDDCMSRIHD